VEPYEFVKRRKRHYRLETEEAESETANLFLHRQLLESVQEPPLICYDIKRKGALPMGDRTILHCDLNGFYASVECLLNPRYRDVPMAVAGNPENRHGIILAKNEWPRNTASKQRKPSGRRGKNARTWCWPRPTATNMCGFQSW
jgi:hypothetical protein